jgi:hypothetical protein
MWTQWGRRNDNELQAVMQYRRNAYKILIENLNGKYYLLDLGVDEEIILSGS